MSDRENSRFLWPVWPFIAAVLPAAAWADQVAERELSGRAATTLASPETQQAAPKLQVRKLREGLHVVLGAGGNVAIWSGANGVVLVDDKLGAVTAELLDIVRQVAPGAIRFVVNTHWHADHTGANEVLGKAGGVIIAQENVRERMSTEQFIIAMGRQVPPSAPAALPVVTFADSLSLHLNEDRLDVEHASAAHTDGDAILWWRDANVVHVGDVFFNGSYPFIDTSSGGSLAGVVAAVEGVLARADMDTIIIPGHGPIATRTDLGTYRDMLVEIGRRVREMIEDGRTLEEIMAVQPTAAFDQRYSSSFMPPEKFLRSLYGDLANTAPITSTP